MFDYEVDNSSKENFVLYIEAELEPIVPSFMQNRLKDVETIATALQQQDFATIARIAHVMKGVGAGYGFDYVTEVGIALGNAARAEEPTEISRQLKFLSHYLEHVIIVYTE